MTPDPGNGSPIHTAKLALVDGVGPVDIHQPRTTPRNSLAKAAVIALILAFLLTTVFVVLFNSKIE
jgi:hypothetical protein